MICMAEMPAALSGTVWEGHTTSWGPGCTQAVLFMGGGLFEYPCGWSHVSHGFTTRAAVWVLSGIWPWALISSRLDTYPAAKLCWEPSAWYFPMWFAALQSVCLHSWKHDLGYSNTVLLCFRELNQQALCKREEKTVPGMGTRSFSKEANHRWSSAQTTGAQTLATTEPVDQGQLGAVTRGWLWGELVMPWMPSSSRECCSEHGFIQNQAAVWFDPVL